jgi:hypothetical protein
MRDINSLTKGKHGDDLDCKQQHSTQTKQYTRSDSARSSYPRHQTWKADLQSVVSTNSAYLSPHDQYKLLELLTEYEELFDGTLCDWKTKPISFELKEGAKPYHDRPSPVPRVHKETIIKELNRLCELGVLEFQPTLEWASPSFITPKKEER